MRVTSFVPVAVSVLTTTGLLLGPCFAVADSVYSSVDLVSSSEPVPVLDMVNGWDGPFSAGEYAYADARAQVGVSWSSGQSEADLGVQRYFVEWQQRWHYDLSFSKGMSRYYYSLEQGSDLAADEVLALDARMLVARGIRSGAQWQLDSAALGLAGQWSVTPALTVYRVSEWQFGSLSGVAEGGESETASASLDYHFSEDKILDYDVDPNNGWGISLDLASEWSDGEYWRVAVQLHDILNRWQLADSGYTDACINFNSPSQQVCSSTATASGKSGQEDYVARLRSTVEVAVEYLPWQGQILAYHHGDYDRLGLEKRWQPLSGIELGAAVYSTAQVGVSLNSRWMRLAVATDDIRSSLARDMDVSLGWQFHW
ncbi:hypothetical protein [Oceanobacter sp. 3_MG-2023]|uniref:hypothetical protein n=1 Tax=Oceanobacter sp. 3_MG-2023 TaxID=3062622 RepID=UPI00273240AE|nr:hypothetical protein [Oceanobacter sp. 3_MG-2023]MDP2504234.1 hypothetical protein [Oceanobacter sp. 3_MG-2023]